MYLMKYDYSFLETIIACGVSTCIGWLIRDIMHKINEIRSEEDE